jgi:hypothetical protein
VAELAGRHLKKVVLELGGSDPFLLLGTDDLDTAVGAAASARPDNAGQTCNAAKRFIVVDDLYEPFLEKFTATVLASQVAPLSSVAAAERREEQVDGAVTAGDVPALGAQRRTCPLSESTVSTSRRSPAVSHVLATIPLLRVSALGEPLHPVQNEICVTFHSVGEGLRCSAHGTSKSCTTTSCLRSVGSA